MFLDPLAELLRLYAFGIGQAGILAISHSVPFALFTVYRAVNMELRHYSNL
jgi:hypothetical protein